MNVSTNARKRNIPAVHQVTLVSSVVAWRPPMIVSVPAPPPMLASPPPCPACNSTAVARISESRMRMPTRIPYMRGARYLGYSGAHKLGPRQRIERRAPDQHTVELLLGQQLGGVLQIDAATVQNSCVRGPVLLQPRPDCGMHRCGIARRRVPARPNRPHRFIG